MQYIDKKLAMPSDIEKWVNKKSNHNYQWVLSTKYHNGYIVLREQLRNEQKSLCCYCCQILDTYAEIEHIKDRNKHPKLMYDYNNLLLSCKNSNQCNNAKGDRELNLTPLMVECDTEIALKTNGELKPDDDSERAKQAINLLNLNNLDLRQRREQAIKDLFNIDKDLNKENLELMFAFMDNEQAEFYRYILNKLIEI